MTTIRERLTKEFRDAESRREYADSLLDSTVATQIKTVREQREWTQAELAAHAGMKQSRISAMEDVNYSSWNVTTLKRLAAAFECGLEVRFVPFSRVMDWATDLSAAALRVAKYDDEHTATARTTTDTASLVQVDISRVKPRALRMSLPTGAAVMRTAVNSISGAESYGQASTTRR